MNGRNCDNCGHSLSDEEFDGYGSWSYTCPGCGFKYSHSSSKTASEQVDQFNGNDNNEEESISSI